METGLLGKLRKVLSKLPYSLQEKWAFRAEKIEDTESRSPGLDDAVDNVAEIAGPTTNPPFGRQTMDGRDEPEEIKTCESEDKSTIPGKRGVNSRLGTTQL